MEHPSIKHKSVLANVLCLSCGIQLGGGSGFASSSVNVGGSRGATVGGVAVGQRQTLRFQRLVRRIRGHLMTPG
jgi:hypothetical protein